MEAIDISNYPALCEALEEDGIVYCAMQDRHLLEATGCTHADLLALEAAGFVTLRYTTYNVVVEPVLAN